MEGVVLQMISTGSSHTGGNIPTLSGHRRWCRTSTGNRWGSTRSAGRNYRYVSILSLNQRLISDLTSRRAAGDLFVFRFIRGS